MSGNIRVNYSSIFGWLEINLSSYIIAFVKSSTLDGSSWNTVATTSTLHCWSIKSAAEQWVSVNPISLPKVTLFPAFGGIITHFQALYHVIFPLLRTKKIYFYPDSPKGKPKNNPTQKTNQTKNHDKTSQKPRTTSPKLFVWAIDGCRRSPPILGVLWQAESKTSYFLCHSGGNGWTPSYSRSPLPPVSILIAKCVCCVCRFRRG